MGQDFLKGALNGEWFKIYYLEINGSDLKLPVEMSVDGIVQQLVRFIMRVAINQRNVVNLTKNKQITSPVGFLSHNIESCWNSWMKCRSSIRTKGYR